MTLRTIITQRASELNLNGYDLARLVRKNHGAWVVSTDHMELYLAGEKDMTSEKLDHVLKALGLMVAVYHDLDLQFLKPDEKEDR